jgi:hypothetical protein
MQAAYKLDSTTLTKLVVLRAARHNRVSVCLSGSLPALRKLRVDALDSGEADMNLFIQGKTQLRLSSYLFAYLFISFLASIIQLLFFDVPRTARLNSIFVIQFY